MHRYQVEAVGKLIGGIEYSYAVKGFGKINPLKPVADDKQDQALNSLLGLLNEKNLVIPDQITQWLYPPAYGYARNRESFPTSSSPGFDSQKVYESAVGQIIDILLQPERLNRLANQKKLTPYLKKIYSTLAENPNSDIIRQTAQIQYLSRLLALSIAENSSHILKASITAELNIYIKNWFSADKESVHEQYMLKLLAMTPEQIKEIKLPVISALPPGAPIGSCGMDY